MFSQKNPKRHLFFPLHLKMNSPCKHHQTTGVSPPTSPSNFFLSRRLLLLPFSCSVNYYIRREPFLLLLLLLLLLFLLLLLLLLLRVYAKCFPPFPSSFHHPFKGGKKCLKGRERERERERGRDKTQEQEEQGATKYMRDS